MTRLIAVAIWHVPSSLFSARLDGFLRRGATRMNRVFICGVLAMLISPVDAKAGDYAVYPFREHISYAFGKAYKVRVTKEMNRRAPQWLETSENPPVSARKALQAADQLAGKLIGKRAGFQRYLEGVCLKPMEDGWVWAVRFHWVVTEGGSTGMPSHLVVIVLMDGAAVRPEVREWNDVNNTFDRGVKKPGDKRPKIRNGNRTNKEQRPGRMKGEPPLF